MRKAKKVVDERKQECSLRSLIAIKVRSSERTRDTAVSTLSDGASLARRQRRARRPICAERPTARAPSTSAAGRRMRAASANRAAPAHGVSPPPPSLSSPSRQLRQAWSPQYVRVGCGERVARIELSSRTRLAQSCGVSLVRWSILRVASSRSRPPSTFARAGRV